MRTTRKNKIYAKGLRILWREINLLDRISKEKGLNSFQRADLVRMLKPLEATIKEDPKKQEDKKPESELVSRAKEIIKEFEKKESSNE